MGINSVGIGSGLNVESIVSQLVALESKPLATLQTKATGINTQISAFSQLKSQIANLQEQAAKLTKKDTWLGNTLTSSNSAAVSGTATSVAVQATYDLMVSQMAAGQTVGSGLVTNGSALGTGKLTITMGQWDSTDKAGVSSGFKPNDKDGKEVSFTVDITAEDDSLAKIAARSMLPRAMSALPFSRITQASAWCCSPRPRVSIRLSRWRQRARACSSLRMTAEILLAA